MKTKEELLKEQQSLVALSQQIEQKKNEVVTRLIEIQGILKYLEEPKKEKNDNNK
jgi:hypothetical protein